MRSSHAAVVWIFERLGLDVALAGDLLEECARGRSTIWYWRQVRIAIWVRIWGVIFHHKLLALRAVATGCAVNAVWLLLWEKFLHFGLPSTPRISTESIASLLVILLTQVATGWIVARTHRAHAIPMVLVFVSWLVVWFLAGSFSEAERLLAASIDQPRFRPYLAWYFMPIFTETAGLLVGGIVGAGAQGSSASTRAIPWPWRRS
jgi:hypothetical protein